MEIQRLNSLVEIVKDVLDKSSIKKIEKEIKLLNKLDKDYETKVIEIENEIKKLLLEKDADYNKNLYDKDMHIKNLETLIDDAEAKIKNYENQIVVISESLSWKITKPLRYLSWVLNFKSKVSFYERIFPPDSKTRIKRDEKIARKLLEEKLGKFKSFTDEAGAEYWNNIEHRENVLKTRTLRRKEKGTLDNYEYWIENNEPNENELEQQRKAKFNVNPKISIVVPLYNTPEEFFRELLFNLYRQTYSNWELCLADGSNEPLENIKNMCKDERIKYKFIGENLGISGNSNIGLGMVTGDFVALLDHDDLLKVDALYEVVKVINENPKVRFIYTDEDKITDIDSPRFDAHFKPDFSPDSLRENNYICHFSVFKKEVMDKLEGFRSEYNGAQDLDIILRMSEIVSNEEIVHIPKVLYHWRISKTSTAGNPKSKLYAYESGKKAVEDHIKRIGLKGTVESDSQMYGLYKIRYAINESEDSASILIYEYETIENLKRCVNSILNITEYQNYKICILDDKENTELQEYLNKTNNDKIKLYTSFGNSKTNFEKLNYVANDIKSKFLVFLNGNLEIEDKKWLEDFIGFARRSEIGAVGGKIFDEDRKIVFAGRAITSKGIINLSKGLDSRLFGAFARECQTQNISAISSDLMIISKEKFDKVSGFDKEYKKISDVELCLKLLDEGYLNIFNPYVYGISYKENCINDEKTELEKDEENRIINSRNISQDKYFNINLDQEKNNYEIRTDKVYKI